MQKGKQSIQRSLLIVCFLLFCLMGIALAAQSYFMTSSSLIEQYNLRLEDILNFVDHNIDADDMKKCLDTGNISFKYIQAQMFLNDNVDEFHLKYLYIIIPKEDGSNTLVNLISATSDAERAAGERDLMIYEESEPYSDAAINKYISAFHSEGISFFRETSEYGTYYTGCKPLVTSSGETIALICADLSIQDLLQTVYTAVLYSVLTVLLIGVVFAIGIVFWLRRSVIEPVLALEKSAREFALESHHMKSFHSKTFRAPLLKSNDEIQSLSEAISKMSEDMKNYVNDILNAEQRAESAEKVVEDISAIAYKDPLTKVKNKAAFNQMAASLSEEMKAGRADFSIVMIDLNNLKTINDKYGHEMGDKYIIGVCDIICATYCHSPVFRLGGDEFTVILQGRDNENRDILFHVLTETFERTRGDYSVEPWERYSAAAGMAMYMADQDENLEEVLRRADRMMYINKKYIKSVPV